MILVEAQEIRGPSKDVDFFSLQMLHISKIERQFCEYHSDELTFGDTWPPSNF
jgi:hypothetical protein